MKETRMGDLHSIAYGGCSSSLGLGLGFDFHNLGVFNADMSHYMGGNSSSPPCFSPLDSEPSTGYLQDALFEFSSKRRRLLLFSDNQETESTDPIERCWNYWNQNENSPEDYGFLSYMNNNDDIEGKQGNESISEEWGIFKEQKVTEEGVCEAFNSRTSSSSSSLNNHSVPAKEPLFSLHPISPYGNEEKRKKKVFKRVVSPFTMVKPGGIDDVTLNDINRRILMPPTRPVRHPVGDFACRPLVSPEGPGLSGKAVVALTKIQTQGRGTITIIRTKG